MTDIQFGRQEDMSLAVLVHLLASHESKALLFSYEDRIIQSGYHITEVKAGNFATLDCGGNPDAWTETVLQVEDLPPIDGRQVMTSQKASLILSQVSRKLALDGKSRLTVEIGMPGEAMRVYDIAAPIVADDHVMLPLQPRAAICKPRHRANQEAAQSCCQPRTEQQSCC
jgi:hypothetical protein